MAVQPYLFFDGRCEQALEFYKKAIGAEVTMLMRFKDSPTPPTMSPSGAEEKIIHSCFKVGDSTIMASDGECGNTPAFQGFSLSISAPSVAEADRIFASLADGGQVRMPQSETFFSPRFGMVTDQFGISWMVIVPM
jgi:PhnB protein